MSTGVKYVSPSAVTDTTLPFLPPDSVMPFSASAASGALLLCDVGHSSVSNPSGVASGIVFPNVAFAQAKALIGGSPAAADLGLTFAPDASFVDGTTGHFERTSKGGLHGIMSQVNNTAVNQGGSLTMATTASVSVMAYILANPTHSYYLSLWDCITRAAGASPSGDLAGILNNAGGATNRLIRFLEGTSAFSGNSLGSAESQAANTTGAQYLQAATAGYGGTAPALGSASQGGAYWGSTNKNGINLQSTGFNKHPSHIFYRLYLEDLTVSGRSYATVAGLDAVAFNRDFGTGGRFNGDTFTAPSTLP